MTPAARVPRTQWLDRVRRDPIPWLLDPANPSSRYLTLRYIFLKPLEMLLAEQLRIVEWAPVQALLQNWNNVAFWGRADNPYFGGPVGNFGTLYLLYQLGMPPLPEIEAACRNLLDRGQADDGRFILPTPGVGSWLCYTGMALQLLGHFGFQRDRRAQAARIALLQAILLHPETLACPLLGEFCIDGLAKVLGALLAVPVPDRTPDDIHAIDVVSRYLVDYSFDFGGRDRRWLSLAYPRYYSGDLVELCFLLAQTPFREHIRFEELLQQMLSLQTNEGCWEKQEATPAFPIERIHQSSRWLTMEAVHTLILLYGDTIYASGRSA